MINKDIVEKIKQNSIGINQKEKYIKTTKKVGKGLIATLMAILLSTSLIACSEINKNEITSNSIPIGIVQEEYKEIDMDLVERDLISNQDLIFDELESVGITIDDIREGSYTPEKLKNIKVLSEEKLIYYYNVLRRNGCEKVVIALGYESWNEFLIKHNYVDKDGNPDISKWIESEYKEITKIGRENLGYEDRHVSNRK